MSWPTDRAVVEELITAADVNLLPVLIASSTLGGSAANIDFTSIPSIYSSLMLVCWLRTDFAGAALNCHVRLNNDSAANYDYQVLAGSAATASASESFGQTMAFIGPAPGATAGASLFSAHVVHFPHYAGTTNNKAQSAISGTKTGTSTGNITVAEISSFWRSNTAVSRVTILPTSGNLVAGSRASLYGMGQ